MWRNITTVGLASLLAIVLQPVVHAEAATVANGGFESGNLSGWTTTNSCGGDSGHWVAYSGTSTPGTGVAISAPPEGTFGAVTEETNSGTRILYQDIALEAGFAHQVSFSLY